MRLEQVDDLPWILGVFRGHRGSLGIAYVTLVGVRRRAANLAVLKTVGFRRSQIVTTVATQASRARCRRSARRHPARAAPRALRLGPRSRMAPGWGSTVAAPVAVVALVALVTLVVVNLVALGAGPTGGPTAARDRPAERVTRCTHSSCAVRSELRSGWRGPSCSGSSPASRRRGVGRAAGGRTDTAYDRMLEATDAVDFTVRSVAPAARRSIRTTGRRSRASPTSARSIATT